MHKLSNKAQFFILTSVMIVGVFFTLSKYINQYSFIDTSVTAEGSEIFMFDNIVEKANKTIKMSNTTNIAQRLSIYKDFVEGTAGDRGYTLAFNYFINPGNVFINMTMLSEKYILKTAFSEPIPGP